ncbi:unnamed protein product [Mytilus edulis]|uniref:Uncharacterized protein n=1 Tax=Mytilus edulis TaxID=6550 RepID=A0A8S3RR30_MYTED|nr:unnamed protein product [Mytilus edulis]
MMFQRQQTDNTIKCGKDRQQTTTKSNEEKCFRQQTDNTIKVMWERCFRDNKPTTNQSNVKDVSTTKSNVGKMFQQTDKQSSYRRCHRQQTDNTIKRIDVSEQTDNTIKVMKDVSETTNNTIKVIKRCFRDDNTIKVMGKDVSETTNQQYYHRDNKPTTQSKRIIDNKLTTLSNNKTNNNQSGKDVSETTNRQHNQSNVGIDVGKMFQRQQTDNTIKVMWDRCHRDNKLTTLSK